MCVSRLHRVVRVVGADAVDVEGLDGGLRRISLLAYDGSPLGAGDWVVTHSGYALSRADPTEARDIAIEVRGAINETEAPQSGSGGGGRS